MTARTALAIALAASAAAACGDNQATDDGAAGPPCAAAFSENFTESSDAPANCPVIDTADGRTTLRFAIPSRTIGADFAIAIDLGDVAGPGLYTGRSPTTQWSADALHEFEMTSCLYHAGTAAVPPGTFELALNSLDTEAHGALLVMLYVLARPYTYCGESNIERLLVKF